MINKISELLKKSENECDGYISFAVEDIIQPSDISIEVDGVGKLDFPLNQQIIEKLIKVSSKAKYGFKDKTLLDQKVRDTHEIALEKLHVTIDETKLGPLLEDLCKNLGLKNGKLIPHLHNMLIYGPKQFFKLHQDSEKLEGMVVSLVIALPSPHIGGKLVIHHNKKTKSLVSEDINPIMAKCIAFYSDCQHEVEEVKQGYRVTLTYNLVFEQNNKNVDNAVNSELREAVREFFASRKDSENQNLVYLLDHNYSEHSLRWDLLKGFDKANSSALSAVAKDLDLITHLALVEIHECWDVEEEYDDYSYSKGRRRRGHSIDDYDDDYEPELGDLIDSDINLNFWLNEKGEKVALSDYSISEDCICYTKNTDDFEPIDKNYEGHMGNYGNTMDYWYRRAAVVLWPRAKETQQNFRLNYSAAITDLFSFTKEPGNIAKINSNIQLAGKFMYYNFNCKDVSYFKKFSTIASYIENKETALSMLANFSWGVLHADACEGLFDLQKKYGREWLIGLLNKWQEKEGDRTYNRDCILPELKLMIQRFVEANLDYLVVKNILTIQLKFIIEIDNKSYSTYKVQDLKNNWVSRAHIVQQMLEACIISSNIEILNQMLDHLMYQPRLYTLLDLCNLFLDLKDNQSGHYKVLKDFLVQGLVSKIDLGVRANDDWSICDALPCTCNLCNQAMQFLQSKTEIKKIWPIVMAAREHVMRKFDGSAIPVEISVEKKGSPHKLVLVKHHALHVEAERIFNKIQLTYEMMREKDCSRSDSISL